MVERSAHRLRTRGWNDVLAGLVLMVAVVGVVLAGMRIEIGGGITVGYAIAMAALPLWFATAARYRYFLPICVLTVAAAATGAWLTAAHAGAYEIIRSGVNVNTALLGGTVVTAGLLLWLRPVLPEWQIAALFGLGLLAVAATAAEPLNGSQNPWKQHWSLPVTVLVLAGAQAVRSRLLAVLGLVALAAVSVANDSRSMTALLAMTAAVVVYQSMPVSAVRLTATRLVVLLVVVGTATYWAFSELALSGTLGLSTRLRTEEQLLRSGSVLLGGRPEIAATVGLFERWPLGFGSGTVLDPQGVAVAQNAMSGINYDGTNGYVTNYMFGRTIELHSGIGDLWAWFGLPGLVLALLLVWALLDALAQSLSTRGASPLQVFVLLVALWNMFFGPFYSLAPVLALALGLMLVPRGLPHFLGWQRPEPDDAAIPHRVAVP